MDSNKPKGNSFDFTEVLDTLCKICSQERINPASAVENDALKSDIISVYEQLTGTQLPPNNNLLEVICFNCINKLKQTHNFRHNYLKSQDILKTVLENQNKGAGTNSGSDRMLIHKQDYTTESLSAKLLSLTEEIRDINSKLRDLIDSLSALNNKKDKLNNNDKKDTDDGAHFNNK